MTLSLLCFRRFRGGGRAPVRPLPGTTSPYFPSKIGDAESILLIFFFNYLLDANLIITETILIILQLFRH
jgi:hypothetical protein